MCALYFHDSDTKTLFLHRTYHYGQVLTGQEQLSHLTKLLQDRVVLVTGASRDIGAATAKLLARHGAAVGVNYYSSESAAQEVVEALALGGGLSPIASEGGKAVAVKADVREISEIESMVQQVTEAFGAINTLILNANATFALALRLAAGIAPFLEHKWEDFEAKLLGELKSAFYPCKAIVPSMVEQRRGCVIAVSSIASRFFMEGFSSHSTAKSGSDGFVKSLAVELGPLGIRVNAVAPGTTLTDATSSMSQE